MKTILLITDGKPGHENISKGVIDTIAQHHRIRVVEVKAKLRSSLFKRAIKMLLNRSILWHEKKWFVKLFYKGDPIPEKTAFDLIVSTGGATSFLNIMLSRYCHAPNIYCSSLRGLKHTHFTHIVSLVEHGYDNEIIVDVAPLMLKFDNEKVAFFKKEYHIQDSDRIWSVLIGGSTKDYIFSIEDMEKMFMNMISLAKKHNAKLCITTSRRTSQEAEQRLSELYKREKGIIKKCVCYHREPEKVIGTFLAIAERIFVTEDSGSMITESVLSQKPVYTIRTSDSSPKGIYKSFMNRLLEKKRVVSVDIDRISALTLKEQITSIEQSPGEKVYNEIKYLLEE